MAYIYKITNKLNNKAYIGKTLKINPKDRFIEHMQESKKQRSSKRALYRAFNKYGEANFNFEILEEIEDCKASEREIFYIELYDTYRNGYNETLGGDGKAYLDRYYIIDEYKKCLNLNKTAEICNIHPKSVKDILNENGIEIINIHIKSKPIKVVYNITYIFQSLTSACKCMYFYKFGYTKEIYNHDERNWTCGAASHIRRAMKNNGISYGCMWCESTVEEYSHMIYSINTKTIYYNGIMILRI